MILVTGATGNVGGELARELDARGAEFRVLVREIRGRYSYLEALTFSPDGSKLFSGFYRGSAIVWEVRREGSAIKKN